MKNQKTPSGIRVAQAFLPVPHFAWLKIVKIGTGRNACATLCVLSFLFALGAMATASVAANAPMTSVKLDNKTFFIPETKLAGNVTPVDSFLYIGSWEAGGGGAGMAQQSLCALDTENNVLQIKSPDKLLGNSHPAVVARKDADAFLDGISWGKRQVTQYAFKVMSDKRQPVVVEVRADGNAAALFCNGKPASQKPAGIVPDLEGVEYLPVMLEAGANIIIIKQFSVRGKPRIQAAVIIDHSHDLQAAWLPQNGLLKKLVLLPEKRTGRTEVPALDWSEQLGNFHVSLEVRDIATNKVVYQKSAARRGRLISGEAANLTAGIYEAAYRTQYENASELFVIGNPNDLYAGLRDALSSCATKYNAEAPEKLAIEAQFRRAQILLLKDNYAPWDREWQEKIAYTLGSLATMKRRLGEGVVNITKDQPGLHIRGFASKEDGSVQNYRLFVPTNYEPGAPMPLLVIVAARMSETARPFIEGPIIANHREAVLWGKYAGKHGFALLWPGYRGIPEGNSHESTRIDEAIQAVERDYAIDKSRISVLGSCGAGNNAGQLVSEYPNRFAAIVYDRAVFELVPPDNEMQSLKEWLKDINPARHVLENRNLKIFVMHDDTKPDGHGEMALTTQFLEHAKAIRNDVVSHLCDQPMGAERMDMTFDWAASCRNEHPGDKRFNIAAKAGYTGPISEIFTTPILIVRGTHASERDVQAMQKIAESVQNSYAGRFHGAECAVKNDDDVTQNDINNHSLILIGNPQSNSVWEKLQPRLALQVTTSNVLYKTTTLAGNQVFQAIVRNPDVPDKYVLMIGAPTPRLLWGDVLTGNLFDAWYDCRLFGASRAIIGKLEARADARSGK